MNLKASHFTIYVLDQDKAYDVYVNKLGFHVATDMTLESGFRWLSVSPPDSSGIEMVLTRPGPPMFEEDHAKAVIGLLEQNAMGGGVFQVEDCQKAYQDLSKKGIEFVRPPRAMFYGLEALFRDGCGNWFSLNQPSGAIPQG